MVISLIHKKEVTSFLRLFDIVLDYYDINHFYKLCISTVFRQLPTYSSKPIYNKYILGFGFNSSSRFTAKTSRWNVVKNVKVKVSQNLTDCLP